jgi:hypothetical protein
MSFLNNYNEISQKSAENLTYIPANVYNNIFSSNDYKS